MTAPITYTHADATTLGFFATAYSIIYHFPGKEIVRQNNKIGITVDPNRGYRVVECIAILTSADLSTLNGYALPAAIPTYDDTDPKIVVYRDGANSFTILCAITAVKATHMSDDKWQVEVQFTERDI
jgi:hypothetical protein